MRPAPSLLSSLSHGVARFVAGSVKWVFAAFALALAFGLAMVALIVGLLVAGWALLRGRRVAAVRFGTPGPTGRRPMAWATATGGWSRTGSSTSHRPATDVIDVQTKEVEGR